MGANKAVIEAIKARPALNISPAAIVFGLILGSGKLRNQFCKGNGKNVLTLPNSRANLINLALAFTVDISESLSFYNHFK